MKKIFMQLFICLLLSTALSQNTAQSNKSKNTDFKSNADPDLQHLYSPDLNHRELVLKSLELAVAKGFEDTSISIQEIRDRLEAGAYSEDFEAIPGITGNHFPDPWDSTRYFDFLGYYPFEKIPYGSYRDTLSGWYRGLNHGYDLVQGFKWPGAISKTVDWANSPLNSYNWNNAVNLYLNGEHEIAYQCLGHILHLLADLSVPSHVKVVNHGIDVVELNSGTPINPDKLELIIDEYELALAGGLDVSGYVLIPDIYIEFQSATDR